MKLKLNEAYRSLKPFEINDLPEFVIITGINGSGKSHLLRAIHEQKVNIELENMTLPRVGYANGFGTVFEHHADDRNTYPNIELIFKEFERLKKFGGDSSPRDKGSHLNSEETKYVFEHILTELPDSDTWNFDNIKFYYPMSKPQQFFATNEIAGIYKKYQDKRCINRYNRFLKSEGETVKSYDDDGFVKKFGTPPWELINSILEEAQIPYRTNCPTYTDHRSDFELELININDPSIKIKFNELSSGESLLAGLGLTRYNTENKDFPNILLMDETDASLHPAMSKQMIDVVRNVFVKKLNIKVFLVTHSPSTVALANEESIFVMDKDEHILKKLSKDEALKTLTTGVPTLSIDYLNHKQVFVEALTDMEYYASVYDKLVSSGKYAYKLYFISSGATGNGDCTKVIDLVGRFVSANNQKVFGIIDWDCKTRKSTQNVLIHGNEARYSIENYLLDPLVFLAYLIEQKKNVDGLWDQFPEINATFNPNDLGKTEHQEKVQVYCDWILEKVFRTTLSKEGTVDVKYHGGVSLKLPKQFLSHQGHSLLGKYKKAFLCIQTKKEVDFMKELINTVVRYFDLVSVDSINMIEELAQKE